MRARQIRTKVWVAWALALGLWAGSASAQEGAPAAASAPAQETNAAQAETEQLYDEGFAAMRGRRWAEARALLTQYLEQAPTGSRAQAATELLRLAKLLDRQEERLQGSGRTELVVFSTIFGIYGGVALWVGFELEESGLLLSFATGGIGLGTSLWLTSGKEISEGDAATISTGGSWGSWNGTALALIFTSEDEPELGKVTTGVGVLGGLAGIGAGVLLNQRLSPDPGDTGLVSSGGLWGTFFAGMGLLIVEPQEPTRRSIFGTLLAGSDLGLLAGALAAPRLDISRSRMQLIDLGGILGVLFAGGVLAIFNEDVDAPIAGGVMSLGALSGLGLGAWATEGWEDPKPARAAFKLHAPSPFLLPARGGEQGFSAGLNLLQGHW